jgi:hypothetical protein
MGFWACCFHGCRRAGVDKTIEARDAQSGTVRHSEIIGAWKLNAVTDTPSLGGAMRPRLGGLVLAEWVPPCRIVTCLLSLVSEGITRKRSTRFGVVYDLIESRFGLGSETEPGQTLRH